MNEEQSQYGNPLGFAPIEKHWRNLQSRQSSAIWYHLCIISPTRFL